MTQMHLYEGLPLFGTGIVLGLALIAKHALLLVKPAESQAFLKTFPRNDKLGQVLLGFGMLWFWLLVAPPDKGVLSFLSMDLGEFDKIKNVLRIAVPISIVLVGLSVKEFLAVRALGLVGLMVAAPLFGAAFQKPVESRLLIPIYVYGLVIASLYFVGMPYLFRDLVTWASASASRWRNLCLAGLTYGVAVLACALLFWKGY